MSLQIMPGRPRIQHVRYGTAGHLHSLPPSVHGKAAMPCVHLLVRPKHMPPPCNLLNATSEHNPAAPFVLRL